MEKELALEFLDILKSNNVKTISLAKLIHEIELVTIKYIKYDHCAKTTLARALKINRTTLTEKMRRMRLSL